MPYAGKILKRDETWTITGLPDQTAVTVLTLNKAAHVAEVDLLVSTGGSVSARIWKNAERVHFRISTLEGQAGSTPFVFSQVGQTPYPVPASTDVSIIADCDQP